ncbi:MAG TPA: hypothetical protein VJN94_18085 [Candidatus Binataceae bacterium]|nr:hypothetical protein [Candidatus Binataceae bacterium]
MAEEKGPTGWRGAIVTTAVAIALNPLMVMVGYYSSKMLAAPKLSVEYATAVVETAPFALDKSITALPILQDIQQFSPYGAFGAPGTFEPCDHQFTSGSLTAECVTQFRTIVQQSLQSIDFSLSYIKRNREAIEQWDGKSDLSLSPLILPNMNEPLEVTARNDRKLAISLLRDNEVSIADIRKELTDFQDKLQVFVSAPIRRTGKVSFRVGVLNSGDSDGVIFPSASLSFHDSKLTLHNGSLASMMAPYVAPFPGVAFNVVRAHSFNEISFVLDDALTPPGAQNEWRSLVTGGVQEKFTIELKTSARPISGGGWLPPTPA